MRQQAAHFGAAQLSRAADIVNAGLTEMRGATAPRLQLELICARVLLPAAEDTERGVAARLDRLERRADIAGAPATATAPADQAPSRRTPAKAPVETPAATPVETPPAAATPAAPTAPVAQPAVEVPAAQPTPEPVAAAPVETPAQPPAEPEPTAAQPAAGGTVDLVTVRRLWPEVLEEVKTLRRYTWTLLSHNAQVAALDDGRITLAMVNAGARDSFLRGGSDEIVREALVRVLGVDWKVDAIVDPSTAPSPAPSRPQAALSAPSGRAAAEAAVAAQAAAEPGTAEAEVAPSVDDDDADDSAETHQDLLARELGAKVIGEYDAS